MLDLLDTAARPIAHQAGLFESLAPRTELDFSRARRVDLDRTSWIEHVPGWLPDSDRLFEELLATAAWEQRNRWMYTRVVVEPRLTAEYADIATAPSSRLRTVAGVLSAHYATDYRSLWINLYRDHRDSTGWHGDRIGRIQAVSTVPVLSLGATRKFSIRPARGGQSISLPAAAGDLIVMGGRCQRDWLHCVPKQAAPAGARISVNFAPERV